MKMSYRTYFYCYTEMYGRYSELCEDEIPSLTDRTKLIDLLSVVEEKYKGENILYNTIITIVRK